MARRAGKADLSGAGEIPPPLELACLTILWNQGEAAVGEVQEALQPARPLAYTTVMTVLERLARKGMVTRRKLGRSFRYAPARDRDQMRSQALSLLISQFFDGSRQELQRFLNGMAEGGAGPTSTDESHRAGTPPAAADPRSVNLDASLL
jgi:predicted transcriptional regulator